MTAAPIPHTESPPLRIAVLIADELALPGDVIKYLVLQLNCLQRRMEFEFLPAPEDDSFLRLLCSRETLDRDNVRTRSQTFVSEYVKEMGDRAKKFELAQRTIPEYLIVISRATLSQNRYSLSKGHVAIQALGKWDRSMAPPSIVEMILALVLRQAVGFVCPAFMESQHLGTKGCLFDFNPLLADAKFKTLQGFLCADCRAILDQAGESKLAGELQEILARKWIRRRSIPGSPASICAKLGFDLFLTRGLQPTFLETATKTLRNDGVKEILRLFSSLLIAVLLLWLGLKKR